MSAQSSQPSLKEAPRAGSLRPDVTREIIRIASQRPVPFGPDFDRMLQLGQSQRDAASAIIASAAPIPHYQDQLISASQQQKEQQQQQDPFQLQSQSDRSQQVQDALFRPSQENVVELGSLHPPISQPDPLIQEPPQPQPKRVRMEQPKPSPPPAVEPIVRPSAPLPPAPPAPKPTTLILLDWEDTLFPTAAHFQSLDRKVPPEEFANECAELDVVVVHLLDSVRHCAVTIVSNGRLRNIELNGRAVLPKAMALLAGWNIPVLTTDGQGKGIVFKRILAEHRGQFRLAVSIADGMHEGEALLAGSIPCIAIMRLQSRPTVRQLVEQLKQVITRLNLQKLQNETVSVVDIGLVTAKADREYRLTRRGKEIDAADQSDLYYTNPMPPLRVLASRGEQRFAVNDWVYYDAVSIEFNVAWVQARMSQYGIDINTDTLYWIYPTRIATLPARLPEVGSVLPGINVKVIDNGADVYGPSRARRTNYVIVRNLYGAKVPP